LSDQVLSPSALLLPKTQETSKADGGALRHPARGTGTTLWAWIFTCAALSRCVVPSEETIQHPKTVSNTHPVLLKSGRLSILVKIMVPSRPLLESNKHPEQLSLREDSTDRLWHGANESHGLHSFHRLFNPALVPMHQQWKMCDTNIVPVR